jgi:hypothetical protein
MQRSQQGIADQAPEQEQGDREGERDHRAISAVAANATLTTGCATARPRGARLSALE